MQKVRYHFDPFRQLWVLSSADRSPHPNKRITAGCMQQEIQATWGKVSQLKPKQSYAYIHLQPTSDGFRLGPIIGILTVGKGTTLLGNKANFIDIMQAGYDIGAFVYVFTPQDILWDEQRIQGRLFDRKTKRWISSLMPFPDVVYNRIPNRQYETEQEVQATLLKLQQIPNLKLFNPCFFDKWELYQMLSPSHLSIHIPKTKVIINESSLKDFLSQYQSVYIKPSSGKAGKGIYYVERKNKGYILKSTKNRETSKSCSSIRNLWNVLYPEFQQKRYLIQQAIPLLTHKGRPFDVRVLVQKNISGNWQVSGVGIRVAGAGGITTHVPQGGKIVSVEKALLPHFGAKGTQKMVGQIKEAALQVARTIEGHFQQLGEMSMDIGISNQGQLWFFEANAKPMKFDEPKIRSTSLRRVIEYSMFLSRFTEEGVFTA